MTTKTKATKKKSTKVKATKATIDLAEGTVTALDPTVPTKHDKAAGKKKTASSKAKAEDTRERLDLTKLKPGDKVRVLEGTRCSWLKPGMVVEFRGAERGTLARIKHLDGEGKSTYTRVGSRNLQRAK
jgi:hypothetical protein